MMSNEEFQKLVLEKLTNLENRFKTLEDGQKALERRQGTLEEGQKALERRQGTLEEGQKTIVKELKGVLEQTANLTEFKEEVIQELESMKASIARVEIATANNWSDIARLKSIK